MNSRSRPICFVVLALLACKPSARPEPAPAPAPAASAPESSTALAGRVASIELMGTTRESEAKAVLRTAVGATYDPSSIASDVRALWRLGGIADVHVDARRVADGVALRYRIEELPRVRKIDVAGGPQVLVSLWKVRTAEIKDVPQDRAVLQRLAVDLRDHLVASGYLDAAVTWRAVPGDEGRVDIVLDVEAGPLVTLAELRLTGNTKVKTRELEALFRAKGIAVGQPFVASGLYEAVLAINARYLDLGHVHAEVRSQPQTRSPDGRTITIAYDIREGDAFRLGKLSFSGALIAPSREYEQLLAVRPRQIFGRATILAGLEKIRAMHRERGAGEADLSIRTDIDRAKKTVDLTVEIAKPQ